MRLHACIGFDVWILKILSVTCNNASANDTMMEELELMLTEFEGQSTRTRCILPRGWEGEELGPEERELRALGQGIDVEDYEMIGETSLDPVQDDDVNGWVDEIALLSAEEKAGLESEIRPIRFALAKVSNDLPDSVSSKSCFLIRSASCPSKLSTRQESSSLRGTLFARRQAWVCGRCHETSPLAGTRPMTWSSSSSITELRLMP
jgi:hypothetical protein